LLFQLHDNGTKLYNSDASKLSTIGRKLSLGDKKFHYDGAQLPHNGASQLSVLVLLILCVVLADLVLVVGNLDMVLANIVLTSGTELW
jgi:hypothetical protein